MTTFSKHRKYTKINVHANDSLSTWCRSTRSIKCPSDFAVVKIWKVCLQTDPAGILDRLEFAQLVFRSRAASVSKQKIRKTHKFRHINSYTHARMHARTYHTHTHTNQSSTTSTATHTHLFAIKHPRTAY